MIKTTKWAFLVIAGLVIISVLYNLTLPKESKTNSRFKTYNGIGHENPEEIKEDVLNFFKEHLN